MNYTVRLYERDENTQRFWPAGQYTYDSLKKAIRSLEYYTTNEGGICGLVTTTGFIAAYKGFSEREALRVSPVKLLAVKS